MNPRGTVYGARRSSTAGFVRNFRRDVDRCVFMFTMTAEQRDRWASTPGASPWEAPGVAALITAGVR